MFLDGMGDQLSWLEEDDGAGESDHGQGDPLDGVEEGWGGLKVWVGLADEGEEELRGACGGEGEGEGIARVAAVAELAEEDDGQGGGGEGSIESHGVETDFAGWDGEAPGERGREASVCAFGKVAEGEEGPGEGGAGTPGVEGWEEREMPDAEIDCGRNKREEDSGRV